MMRRVRHVSLCIAVLAASGCAQYYYGERGGVQVRTDVLQTNYEAADRLLQAAPLDPRRSVLVSTIVSVDRLNESSRLGRLFSEQIAGRLVQRGVRVTALKWQEPLAVQQRHPGELLVPREWHEVGQAHDAQAVVVGTYAVSARQLYISLKLVSPAGNAVVAAHDYVVPVDDDVRTLLRGR